MRFIRTKNRFFVELYKAFIQICPISQGKIERKNSPGKTGVQMLLFLMFLNAKMVVTKNADDITEHCVSYLFLASQGMGLQCHLCTLLL